MIIRRPRHRFEIGDAPLVRAVRLHGLDVGNRAVLFEMPPDDPLTVGRKEWAAIVAGRVGEAAHIRAIGIHDVNVAEPGRICFVSRCAARAKDSRAETRRAANRRRSASRPAKTSLPHHSRALGEISPDRSRRCFATNKSKCCRRNPMNSGAVCRSREIPVPAFCFACDFRSSVRGGEDHSIRSRLEKAHVVLPVPGETRLFRPCSDRACKSGKMDFPPRARSEKSVCCHPAKNNLRHSAGLRRLAGARFEMKRSSDAASSAAFAVTKRTTATKMKTAALIPLPTPRCTALRRRGRGLTPRITL